MIIRSILRLVFVALLSVALSGSLVSAADAKPFPDRIELPTGFQPEGITIGPRSTAYFGSLANGAIYAANLRTGEGSVIIDGEGVPAVGLKIDNRRRLFVAGGNTGTGRVLDARPDGDILEFYTFTAEPSFINDVVLTRDYAWFTDSFSAVLYGVPVAPGGELGDPADVVTLPLIGDWKQEELGFNANGIAETPDRQALLVVNTTSGLLYRVDPETGEATQVDLGGTSLSGGDGLLVVGTTLYVVQGGSNQVTVITLDPAGTSGVVAGELTSRDFDVPTTVARFGNSLYLPNARFSTPPTPTTTYSVTRIDRH
jgi:sugar lactone lactonase YvrE